MNNPNPAGSVERLFPFVLRAKILLIGREKLRHNKGKLHFVLITTDIAEAVRGALIRAAISPKYCPASISANTFFT